jgi:hypothetical protein
MWRVGRKLGRTLYKDDVCVGMVDSPEIAADIVASMNVVGVCRHCGKKVDAGYNCCASCADERGP